MDRLNNKTDIAEGRTDELEEIDTKLLFMVQPSKIQRRKMRSTEDRVRKFNMC